jgi:hypothetical protein
MRVFTQRPPARSRRPPKAASFLVPANSESARMTLAAAATRASEIHCSQSRQSSLLPRSWRMVVLPAATRLCTSYKNTLFKATTNTPYVIPQQLINCNCPLFTHNHPLTSECCISSISIRWSSQCTW